MNILLAPIKSFIFTNTQFLNIRSGYPCAHALRVTNELKLDMIKVQHLKLYATLHNDDDDSLGTGLE
jgi:hypothetical protein